MKTILLYLTIIAAFIFSRANAQFISTPDCGAGGIGHSIWFMNADTGFVAGEDVGKGVIQQTLDGGNTWNRVYQSVTNLEWVEDICFVNATDGFAVGANGTILQTTNCGTSWSVQSAGLPYFNSVCFPTSATGYIAGGTTQGVIYKTTDGGMSWTAQASNADSTLRSIFFLNADTGYAVGNSDFVKTTDGGTTWTRIALNYPGYGSAEHLEMYCTNDSTCFIPYNGIQKTNDRGNTWTSLTLPPTSPPFVYFITSIHFTDAMTGYASGAYADTSIFSLTGIVLKTTDGGLSWTNINTAANNTALQQIALSSIRFVDQQTGYSTGSNGKVIKTTNAGGSVTGIISNESSEEVRLFPNPANGQLVIETNATGQQTVEVYDLNGKKVLSISVQGKAVIDVTSLNEGIYTLMVKTAGSILTKKLAVIH